MCHDRHKDGFALADRSAALLPAGAVPLPAAQPRFRLAQPRVCSPRASAGGAAFLIRSCARWNSAFCWQFIPLPAALRKQVQAEFRDAVDALTAVPALEFAEAAAGARTSRAARTWRVARPGDQALPGAQCQGRGVGRTAGQTRSLRVWTWRRRSWETPSCSWREGRVWRGPHWLRLGL